MERLSWELKWIDTNKHLYSSDMHADAVKRNVEKRYLILGLEKRVKELECQLLKI